MSGRELLYAKKLRRAKLAIGEAKMALEDAQAIAVVTGFTDEAAYASRAHVILSGVIHEITEAEIDA